MAKIRSHVGESRIGQLKCRFHYAITAAVIAIGFGEVASSYAAPANNTLPMLSHGMGLEPPTPADFAGHPSIKMRGRDATRPDRLVLDEYLPPIADQGNTQSCVGWCTAYYCFTATVAHRLRLPSKRRADPHFIFSPAFIWSQFNHGDPHCGMRIAQALDILATQGCSTIDLMPWDPAHVGAHPSKEAVDRARRFKARQPFCLFKGISHGDAPNPEMLKTWLWEKKQPFVIGIYVYDDFLNVPHTPNYVYSRPSKGYLSGHAVCIIGYDDTKKAFRAVNSWSSAWGDEGFVWISEEYLRKYSTEGWGIIPGGPVARGPENDPSEEHLIVVEPGQD